MSSAAPNTGATTSDSSANRALIWTSGITALGRLLFGYDTGVVSGALLFLHTRFADLSSLQKELLTSLLLVGAAAGAFVAGRAVARLRWSCPSTSELAVVYFITKVPETKNLSLQEIERQLA